MKEKWLVEGAYVVLTGSNSPFAGTVTARRYFGPYNKFPHYKVTWYKGVDVYGVNVTFCGGRWIPHQELTAITTAEFSTKSKKPLWKINYPEFVYRAKREVSDQLFGFLEGA